MKRFCITANLEKDPEGRFTAELAEFLRSQGCTVCICDPLVPGEDAATRLRDIPKDTECVVVLGGDGTFLHAAKAMLSSDAAILGINLGTLGFLTAAEYHGAREALLCVIRDEYSELSLRTLTLTMGGREYDAAALNEIVVSRNGFSRLIRLQVVSGGQIVSDYLSDGVIVSTPIGSTGYSLSAGGPIVQPHARVLLITPICPHNLQARPLVVSDEDVITVRVLKGSRSIPEEAVVSADGDEIGKLNVGEEITIRLGVSAARVLRVGSVTFWERVKSKL